MKNSDQNRNRLTWKRVVLSTFYYPCCWKAVPFLLCILAFCLHLLPNYDFLLDCLFNSHPGSAIYICRQIPHDCFINSVVKMSSNVPHRTLIPLNIHRCFEKNFRGFLSLGKHWIQPQNGFNWLSSQALYRVDTQGGSLRGRYSLRSYLTAQPRSPLFLSHLFGHIPRHVVWNNCFNVGPFSNPAIVFKFFSPQQDMHGYHVKESRNICLIRGQWYGRNN